MNLTHFLGPDTDQPLHVGPVQAFMIASVPRSGSTLLGGFLRDTGRAGDPREYLNPAQTRLLAPRLEIGRRTRWKTRVATRIGATPDLWWSASDAVRYLRGVARVRTTPNGRFGIKVHYDHMLRTLLRRGTCLEAAFGPVVYVRISRSDRIAQAISFFRASYTESYSSDMAPARPLPAYDFGLVSHFHKRLDAEEQGWDRFFAETGHPVLHLRYEELAKSPESIMPDVFRWIGLPPDTPVSAPALEKQRDGWSREVMERYVHDLRRRDLV